VAFHDDLEAAKLEVERSSLRAQQAELRVRELEHELSVARSKPDRYLTESHRFQLYRAAISAGKLVLVALGLSLWTWVLDPIALDFAGKNTRLDGSFQVTLAFSVVTSVSLVVTWGRSRARKHKIKKLRARVSILERDLEKAERQVRETGANVGRPRKKGGKQ
jgi:hypothetical protein